MSQRDVGSESEGRSFRLILGDVSQRDVLSDSFWGDVSQRDVLSDSFLGHAPENESERTSL